MNTKIKQEYPFILPINEYPDFSERLRCAMTIRNCSVAELAEALYVTSPTISSYRSGTRHPDLDNLKLICKKLHVSADFLLGLDEYIYL